jgi:hypothetical protein
MNILMGAVMFVVSAADRRMRRYALSAALWCACWGPCVVGLMLLAGLAMVAEGLMAKGFAGGSFSPPPFPEWKVYAILGAIGTAVFATAVAWVHQLAISRMTLALFRVYTTLVVAGIGGTLGVAWAVWLATLNGVPYRWLAAPVGIVLFTAGFGYGGFRWVNQLRGERPERLQWVSQEEFGG